MKITSTKFENIKIIKINDFFDFRGILKKFYDKKDKKIKFDIHEAYSTISKKGSVRGLHGQYGKHSQAKIIYCIKGTIIYLGIDLRKKSKTYTKIFKKRINAKNSEAIMIPKGFAHGLISLQNETIVLNLNSSFYKPEYEFGINIRSLNLKLPQIELKITNKDSKLPSLNNFLNKKK
tara:strand:- start:5958 stop:6488 length:531 start_codon:yes stop_codon:yes gene_type:complete